MNAELHAYRASDELAAELLAHQVRDREFSQRVQQFDREHPGHELLWAGGGWSADMRPVGFRDGETEVPEGLSRAQKRTELRPKRGKAGAWWQEQLDWAKQRPSLDKVFRAFRVPCSADGPYRSDLSHYVAPTQWANCGDDGVIVFNSYDLVREHREDRPVPEPLTEHLTPIPLSEFYAIKERLESEQAAVS